MEWGEIAKSVAGFGRPGLAIAALVILAFIFFKWGLPQLKEMNLGLGKTFREGHAAALEMIAAIGGKVDRLAENDARHERRLNSIEMTQMKKDVYNPSMPYVERVWSAHKYLLLGGNGGIKQYILGAFREADGATFDSVWKLADDATGAVPTGGGEGT